VQFGTVCPDVDIESLGVPVTAAVAAAPIRCENCYFSNHLPLPLIEVGELQK